MSTQKKMWPIVVTVVAAVGAFLLTRVIWPDAQGAMTPSADLLPFFILFSVIESLAFGIGVAFLIFGWSFMSGRSTGEWLVFFAAAWNLVSWWPHDNLHRVMEHGDFAMLLKLEYGFHLTLMIAGLIIASHLWKLYSARA